MPRFLRRQPAARQGQEPRHWQLAAAPLAEPVRFPDPLPRLHDQLDVLTRTWHMASPAVLDMTADKGGVTSLTWEEFDSRISALAAGLHATGVRSSDRVALLIPPGIDLLVIFYACLRIGAVSLITDSDLRFRQLRAILRDARAQWIIGPSSGLGMAHAANAAGRRISVDALSPRSVRMLGSEASVQRLLRSYAGQVPEEIGYPSPDSPAAVFTAAAPGGNGQRALYTHRQFASLAEHLRSQFPMQPGACLISGYTPFALLGPAMGAASVKPASSVAEPETLTAAAAAEAAMDGRARMFFASEAALLNVVETAEDLTEEQRESFEDIYLVVASGPLCHPGLWHSLRDLFPSAEIHAGYGTIEGLGLTDIAYGPDTSREPPPAPCTGAPVAGVSFAVDSLDSRGLPSGKTAPAQQFGAHRGQLGELLVAAPQAMAGYDGIWDLPHRWDGGSAEGPTQAVQWYRTGDAGWFDAEGRLWFEGPLEHLITTPFGALGPASLEAKVNELEGVASSAAVGLGPPGRQDLVMVVRLPGKVRKSRLSRPVHATAELADKVRRVLGETDVYAVLVREEFPYENRQQLILDRLEIASWAQNILG